jgi:hypothetical protein
MMWQARKDVDLHVFVGFGRFVCETKEVITEFSE